MATIKRFIKAVREYYTLNQIGDMAFLKLRNLEAAISPDITAQLQNLEGYYPIIDLEQLSQLQIGTLGYEYAQHMQKHNIQPLRLSPDLREEADRHPFALRYTITHDIFHVLLGFDTSYAGELGVLSFNIAQGYFKIAIAMMQPLAVLIHLILAPNQINKMRTNFRKGKALGKQAKCLLRQISDIRSELGLVLEEEQLDTVGSQLQGTMAA
ncbi:MAG: hypothetical protein HC815_25760 [Richelia sp. RM1_1_1]|nr:hypothetical protein [Richelia sp. RM1_1_1]